MTERRGHYDQGRFIDVAPGILLGGIIIEIRGEQALVHHGGYRDTDNHWVSDPIEVSWHTEGPNLVFNLRGWKCRIMQVIEDFRYLDLLATPIHTSDGTFTVDWAHGVEGPSPKELKVWYA